MNWTLKGGYYELDSAQMSEQWMRARQYRLTTSKWSQLDDPERLADSICGDPILNTSKLSTEVQNILANEDNVRQAYIHYKGNNISNVKTPGLLIPNPLSRKYNFVPDSDKHLLLHLGCSPDLVGTDPKSKREIAVELKQPLSGVIYPSVAKYKCVHRYHKKQVSVTGGLVGSVYNDYFVWTEDNGSICVKTYTGRKSFQDDILVGIDFIRNYVIPRSGSKNLVLPLELQEYYHR